MTTASKWVIPVQTLAVGQEMPKRSVLVLHHRHHLTLVQTLPRVEQWEELHFDFSWEALVIWVQWGKPEITPGNHFVWSCITLTWNLDLS